MTLEDKLINAHHKLWLRFVAINDKDGLIELYEYTALTGALVDRNYVLKDINSSLKKSKSKKRKSK